MDTILTGDCRDILPGIADKSFAFGFADPPYWVGFDYGGKTDEEMDYIDPGWLVEEMVRICGVACITPGIVNYHDYPRADWILCWYKPGSTRRSKLRGFNVWEPILVYGGTVFGGAQDAIRLPDIANHTSDGSFHTCPKPEALLRWLISGFTEVGDTCLDPVSGSGTTCKAAYQLGRHYLGIEIDPTYAELSVQRIAQSQPPLFTPPVTQVKMGLG